MFNLKRILDKNSSDVDGRMDNSEQKKHKQENNGYAQQCCMQYCIIGNDFCTNQYDNWDGKKVNLTLASFCRGDGFVLYTE